MARLMTTPAAVDAERAVLGALLLDSAQMLAVAEVLPPGHSRWFYHEPHRLIYDACLTLFDRRDPIDLFTVTDVLQRRGQLDKIGGSVYLAELTEVAVTTANTAHHAGIVKDKALLRSVINVGQDLIASGYEQEDVQGLLARTQAILLQLAQTQTVSAVTDIAALMTQTIHAVNQMGEGQAVGVDTGLHGLNHYTHGFQPVDLIILAARPSQGKSALALQFATAAAAHLHHQAVLFYSLEMSKAQLGLRLLCSQARVDAMQVRRGFVSQPEWGRLLNASERLRQLPLVFDDTPTLSVMDIRARSRRLQLERGLGLVIIDYLQLLTPARRSDNRNTEVAAISRDLKILAKELNVPVIALSQLSREVENAATKCPCSPTCATPAPSSRTPMSCCFSIVAISTGRTASRQPTRPPG
jgi:replicative DNA helicase